MGIFSVAIKKKNMASVQIRMIYKVKNYLVFINLKIKGIKMLN